MKRIQVFICGIFIIFFLGTVGGVLDTMFPEILPGELVVNQIDKAIQITEDNKYSITESMGISYLSNNASLEYDIPLELNYKHLMLNKIKSEHKK